MADSAQLNHRQRKFAELIVAGQTAKAAYFEAFPRCRKESTANVEGCKLLKNPKVAAFIEALRWEVEGKAKESLVDVRAGELMDMHERRAFLAQIKRSAPGEIDEDSPLCQSFKFTDTTREIKMPDKLRAIQLDAQLAGELKERPTPAEGVTIVINAGMLPALQGGYKEFREVVTHGKN